MLTGLTKSKNGNIVDLMSPNGGVIIDGVYTEIPSGCDIVGNFAIMHVGHGGINVQGCECGHANCTGFLSMRIPRRGKGVQRVYPANA